MPPLYDLSDLQLSVMRVLWTSRAATASEVRRALHPSRPLAITTVSTLLSRLEQRGLVGHTREGGSFRYHARVAEGAVRRSMPSNLVKTLFPGDTASVVSHLVERKDVSKADLDRMQSLIKSAKRSRKKRK